MTLAKRIDGQGGDGRTEGKRASFGARLVLLALMTVAGIASRPAAARQVCEDIDYEGQGYTVCAVDTTKDKLALFWRDASGKPFATFDQLAATLAQTREKLVFGMNAGMFQTDLSPLGLYIEDGRVRHRANTREGGGNFHMKPNGVFFSGPDGVGILETSKYLEAHLHPDFATQSGPMLVVDGEIHPKIQPDGTSAKIRNGVGVRDTHQAVFAISREPVTFHQFASLFRDRLGCRNALFLDGTISSLYAPSLDRTLQWTPVGPMLGVTEAKP